MVMVMVSLSLQEMNESLGNVPESDGNTTVCEAVWVYSLATWQHSRCCVVVGTCPDKLLLSYAGEQH